MQNAVNECIKSFLAVLNQMPIHALNMLKDALYIGVSLTVTLKYIEEIWGTTSLALIMIRYHANSGINRMNS